MFKNNIFKNQEKIKHLKEWHVWSQTLLWTVLFMG